MIKAFILLFLHCISLTNIDNCVSLEEFLAVIEPSDKAKNRMLKAFKSVTGNKGTIKTSSIFRRTQREAKHTDNNAKSLHNRDDESSDESGDDFNDRTMRQEEDDRTTTEENDRTTTEEDDNEDKKAIENLLQISNLQQNENKTIEEKEWIVDNVEDLKLLEDELKIENVRLLSDEKDLERIHKIKSIKDTQGAQAEALFVKMGNDKEMFIKIYEINQTITSDIPELDVLEQLSNRHPLYLPIYFGCVVNTNDNTKKFAILEERMTKDMNSTIKEHSFLRSFSSRLFLPMFGELSDETKIGLILMPILGLMAMHAEGIVHMDIKPANLVYKEQNGIRVIKLIDFGVSHDISGKTEEVPRKDREIGSPFFMDPNMVNKSFTYDQFYKADAYCLGLTLIYIIYGSDLIQHPGFKGISEHEIIMKASGLQKTNENRYDNIKSYFELLNKYPEKGNEDQTEGLLTRRELFVRFNKTLLGLIEYDHTNRLSVKEAADMIEGILREFPYGDESPYLQKNADYLSDQFYDADDKTIIKSNLLIKKPFTSSAFWSKKDVQTSKAEPQISLNSEEAIFGYHKVVVNENNNLFKLTKKGMALPQSSPLGDPAFISPLVLKTKLNPNLKVSPNFKEMAAKLFYQQNERRIFGKRDDLNAIFDSKIEGNNQIANPRGQNLKRVLQLSPLPTSSHSVFKPSIDASNLQFGKQPTKKQANEILLPALPQKNIRDQKNQPINQMQRTSNDFYGQNLPQIKGAQINNHQFELI